jgi:DNA-nicking Smr family endonuclease
MNRKPVDHDLWIEVIKSVKPLRKPAHLKSHQKGMPTRPAHPPTVSAPHVHIPRPTASHPPPLTGFDRRTAQKLSRGQVQIEARLDLHGHSLELARHGLLQFLHASQSQGQRTVLVITGKGDSPFSRHTLHGRGHFHAPERQGRLRQAVPVWLHETEFRAVVSGYQPAHPRHGGGGAFYVRIRRIRPRP